MLFRNYYKTTTRYIRQHKGFALLYLFCLSLGITFALAIGIYILTQYRVNRDLKNIDRQYILQSEWDKNEGIGIPLTTLAPLARTLQENYPDLVAQYYRYSSVANVVSAGTINTTENIAIGDTTLISQFGFKLLHGDGRNAFEGIHSAVVTESLALKLYGKSDARGEQLSIQTTLAGVKQPYTVSAVMQDPPKNSVTHILKETQHIFVPFEGNRYFGNGDTASDWNNPYVLSYISVKPNVSVARLDAAIKEILQSYTKPNIQCALKVKLVPLKDYYLTQDGGAAKQMINILFWAALFLLGMAILNYVNITLGTAAGRLKEIGIRKLFGGTRRQLMLQFLGEALILSLLSGCLSLLIYEVCRPVFAAVLDSSMPSVIDFDGHIFVLLLVVLIFTGLLAGIYPALVLSAARMVNAVKGKVGPTTKGANLQSLMLTIQFSIAIAACMGAITVSRQVDFIFNQNLGYDKEQILVISALPKQWDTAGVAKMKTAQVALLKLNAVKEATLCFEIPNRTPANAAIFEAANGTGHKVSIPIISVDENYAATFGLQLLNGSCFYAGSSLPPNRVVLNESAVKALGLEVETAVNQEVREVGSEDVYTIAGVVKDYFYASLREGIQPVLFAHVRDLSIYRFMALKLSTKDMPQTLSTVKAQWQDVLGDVPFEYTFMDEQFKFLYTAELQLKQAAYVTTFLNFIIAILGIVGVLVFTLQKREKEIAVRVVLGAKPANIIALFGKYYAVLLLLSTLIAAPLMYVLLNQWLANYVFHIQQNIWVLVLVFLFFFGFTCALIGFMYLGRRKVAISKQLRDE